MVSGVSATSGMPGVSGQTAEEGAAVNTADTGGNPCGSASTGVTCEVNRDGVFNFVAGVRIKF